MNIVVDCTLDVPEGYRVCVKPKWFNATEINVIITGKVPELPLVDHYTHILTCISESLEIRNWQIEVNSLKGVSSFLISVDSNHLIYVPANYMDKTSHGKIRGTFVTMYYLDPKLRLTEV